jgi:hypothetical protein
MLIRFGGQSIVPNTPIPATGFLTLDISQVLDATDKIEIQASAAGVSLFVSGVEVTA